MFDKNDLAYELEALAPASSPAKHQTSVKAQAARAAGLRFDWQARRYQQQARNFSMHQLVQLHGRVAEADRAMKSGSEGSVIMPTLIAAIAAT